MINRNLLILILFILPTTLFAQESGDCFPKEGKHFVYNQTDFISDTEVESLETMLYNYYDSTSTQMVVVIRDNICNMDLAQYATELGEDWGVGEAEFDNGVVMLIVPVQRELFIATGYGVEHVLTDALCRRIIENVITPEFKAGNNYQGIEEGLDAMMGLLSGEYSPDDLEPKSVNPWLIIIIVFLFIIGIPILLSILGVKGGGGGGGTTYSGGGWTGGTYSGGSGGGGFGGFGGGSFGGGGAGGSW